MAYRALARQILIAAPSDVCVTAVGSGKLEMLSQTRYLGHCVVHISAMCYNSTMQVGVIVTYSEQSATGTIQTPAGEHYRFMRSAGRGMASVSRLPVPVLGMEVQPQPFGLKAPEVGDGVLFSLDTKNQVTAWAYARHFVELVEQLHGTSSRSGAETDRIAS